MKIKLALLLSSLFLISTTKAQSFTPKYSLGVDYGSIRLANTTASLASSLVSSVGGSVSVTQSSTLSNFRMYGGYDFTEELGLEIGYNNTSSIQQKFSGTAGSTYSYASYSGTFGTKFTGLDYSAIYRPNNSWLENYFFRLGMHSLASTTSGSVTASTSTVSTSSKISGTGLMYGFGYDRKISDSLDIRAQYILMNSIAGVSGTSSNMYMVGIRKSF